MFSRRSLLRPHLIMMPVVAVAQLPVGITIPKECDDKPYEQRSRDRHRHDHVLYLMTQVHKLRNDIERFRTGQDQVHPIEHQLGWELSVRLDMNGRQRQLKER